MFQSGGGGGFGLPVGGSPIELLITLLIVLGIVWLVTRLFSS